MPQLKSILFYALIIAFSLGIGVGGGKLYSMWKLSTRADFTHKGEPALITGIGDAPAMHGFSARTPAEVKDVLARARACFATAVGVAYTPAFNSDSLREAVKAIHDQRLRAIVLPPGNFSERDPYPQPLAKIAADAQAAGVDVLCISWLNAVPDPSYWMGQALEVKGVFRGRVILAGLASILPGIECWDAADWIGAIGPIAPARRLPHAPDDIKPHDLRVAWSSALTSLESLARAHKKSLALLNMDVPASNSYKLLPADSSAAYPVDAGVQKAFYEALLLETKGRAAFTHVLLFNWGDKGDLDAPNQVNGMLDQIAQAWDPKRPRPAETAPQPDSSDDDMAAAAPATSLDMP